MADVRCSSSRWACHASCQHCCQQQDSSIAIAIDQLALAPSTARSRHWCFACLQLRWMARKPALSDICARVSQRRASCKISGWQLAASWHAGTRACRKHSHAGVRHADMQATWACRQHRHAHTHAHTGHAPSATQGPARGKVVLVCFQYWPKELADKWLLYCVQDVGGASGRRPKMRWPKLPGLMQLFRKKTQSSHWTRFNDLDPDEE